MAWNEPGGNRNNQDPWGGGNRGRNDGPPDLDEVIRKGLDKLNRLFGGKSGGNGGSSGSNGSGGIIAVVMIALIVFLGFNSFYTVDQRERGIVLRFGKYLKTVGPGLQFKVPLVDHVEKREVTNVRIKTKSAQMLTQDENIVEIDLSVQYVIKDLQPFLLDVRDAERTLDYAIDSALRHEVGASDMDSIITEGRSVLAINVQQRLQHYIDSYNAGIEIRQIVINDTRPPQEVKAAFDDVQRAKEDERRSSESAEAYRNKVIPEAYGRASRIMEEAKAYKQEVIARAQGETSHFLALLDQYEKSPDIMRERLYIDTMQKVLSNSSKVLVDVSQGNSLMYLPLDKVLSNAKATSGASLLRNDGATDVAAQTVDASSLKPNVIPGGRLR